jgi:hypothetical protein
MMQSIGTSGANVHSWTFSYWFKTRENGDLLCRVGIAGSLAACRGETIDIIYIYIIAVKFTVKDCGGMKTMMLASVVIYEAT